MRRTPGPLVVTLVVTLLSIALVPMSARGVDDGASGSPSSTSEDLVLRESTREGRVEQLELWSPALESVTRVIVLHPDSAPTSGPPPALLLLHGVSGDEMDWPEKGNVEALTRGSDLLVVMPDGGRAGFYTNWFNRGRGGPPAWETFHVEELVPFVNDRYGSDPGRWAVAGLSMGGFGALKYAALHPDRFRAALGISAMATPGFLGLFSRAGTASYVDSQYGVDPDDLFGDPFLQEVRWRGNDPADLASNLHSVPVLLDWGTGRPRADAPPPPDLFALFVEIFIDLENRSFLGSLDAAGVPYTALRRDGVHDWPDFTAALARNLPALRAALDPRAGAPDGFSYRTIEPSFSVWGWEVEAKRDVAEFLDLDDVGRDGLSLTGSGAVDVRTPPAYCPATPYPLDGAGEPESLADADGRLEFEVDLGPPSPHQAFTIQDVMWRQTTGSRPRTVQVGIDIAAGDQVCAAA